MMVDGAETFAGIMRDVLKVDAAQIDDDSTAEDVEAWNSMTHIQLITALEGAFDLRFPVNEVVGVRTIGDLKRLLNDKGVQV